MIIGRNQPIVSRNHLHSCHPGIHQAQASHIFIIHHLQKDQFVIHGFL